MKAGSVVIALAAILALGVLGGSGCGGSDAAPGMTETEDGDGDGSDAEASGIDGDTNEAGDSEDDAEADSGWNYRDRWAAPAETWSACPEKEYLGGLTLREKAAYYDWIVPKLHQAPPTAAGNEAHSRVFTIQCDGEVPATIVPDDQLPFCKQDLSENNGLWTSLYVASQAFRWAATGDPGALYQLRRTLNGTYQQLLITGKSGLYARDFRDPTLPWQYCIEQEPGYANAPDDNSRYSRYIPPDEHMVGNQFVRIDADGCFMTWDTTLNAGAGGWAKDAEHCTDVRFAGFCWQRNASKDEYAGHMFAAGIAAKLVDDPEVRRMAVDILGQVGRHLVDHDFWINDYDGRQTRFGSAHAMSLDEMPGSNAVMALAWIKEAAVATGDAELAAVYDDCLLQMSGVLQCIDQPFETPKDYREHLDNMGLALGCSSNYDTISIAELNYFNLIWYEQNPALRGVYRDKFRDNTQGPDAAGRDLWNEADPFRNMILVSRMEPGYDPGEAKKLIGDAVCSLKRFQADNIQRARNSTGYPEWCASERHGSLAENTVPVDERCPSIFEWWGDPNERESCGEDLKRAEPPAGYLLPYWMGRYFGFIGEEM